MIGYNRIEQGVRRRKYEPKRLAVSTLLFLDDAVCEAHVLLVRFLRRVRAGNRSPHAGKLLGADLQCAAMALCYGGEQRVLVDEKQPISRKSWPTRGMDGRQDSLASTSSPHKIYGSLSLSASSTTVAPQLNRAEPANSTEEYAQSPPEWPGGYALHMPPRPVRRRRSLPRTPPRETGRTIPTR